MAYSRENANHVRLKRARRKARAAKEATPYLPKTPGERKAFMWGLAYGKREGRFDLAAQFRALLADGEPTDD